MLVGERDLLSPLKTAEGKGDRTREGRWDEGTGREGMKGEGRWDEGTRGEGKWDGGREENENCHSELQTLQQLCWPKGGMKAVPIKQGDYNGVSVNYQ